MKPATKLKKTDDAAEALRRAISAAAIGLPLSLRSARADKISGHCGTVSIGEAIGRIDGRPRTTYKRPAPVKSDGCGLAASAIERKSRNASHAFDRNAQATAAILYAFGLDKAEKTYNALLRLMRGGRGPSMVPMRKLSIMTGLGREYLRAGLDTLKSFGLAVVHGNAEDVIADGKHLKRRIANTFEVLAFREELVEPLLRAAADRKGVRFEDVLLRFPPLLAAERAARHHEAEIWFRETGEDIDAARPMNSDDMSSACRLTAAMSDFIRGLGYKSRVAAEIVWRKLSRGARAFSAAEVAAEAGCHEKTVQRLLPKMKAAGLLSIEAAPRPIGRRGFVAPLRSLIAPSWEAIKAASRAASAAISAAFLAVKQAPAAIASAALRFMEDISSAGIVLPTDRVLGRAFEKAKEGEACNLSVVNSPPRPPDRLASDLPEIEKSDPPQPIFDLGKIRAAKRRQATRIYGLRRQAWSYQKARRAEAAAVERAEHVAAVHRRAEAADRVVDADMVETAARLLRAELPASTAITQAMIAEKAERLAAIASMVAAPAAVAAYGDAPAGSGLNRRRFARHAHDAAEALRLAGGAADRAARARKSEADHALSSPKPKRRPPAVERALARLAAKAAEGGG